MAIFTSIQPDELDNLLEGFYLSPHLSFQGITQGTVNSNYQVVTQQGTFVLTILEHLSLQFSQSIIDYTQYLHQNNIPCPAYMKHQSGLYLTLFKDKPVTLTQFLKGHHIEIPKLDHCEQIGQLLAKIHGLGLDYSEPLPNTMGNDWRKKTFQRLASSLPSLEKETLLNIMELQDSLSTLPLPKGMVHFDLFRDNVFFKDNHLQGIIDFYYACQEVLILDLAIALNDWCTLWGSTQPQLEVTKVEAFLRGYESVRQLQNLEKDTLVEHCQLACAHFWLARASTILQAKEGEGHFEKDPQEFKQLNEQIVTHKEIIKTSLQL